MTMMTGCANNFEENQNPHNVATNLVDAIGMLSIDNQFVDIDLGLSNEEIAILYNLHVDKQGMHWSEDGLDGLGLFFKDLGNDDDTTKKTIDIIDKILNKLSNNGKYERPSISIDAINDKDLSKLGVGWHQDLDGIKSPKLKAVLVLKGPGTLFCDLPQEQQPEMFASIENFLSSPMMLIFGSISNIIDSDLAKTFFGDSLNNYYKYFIASLFKESFEEIANLCNPQKGHKIHQTKLPYATLFIENDKTLSAVHSAPPAFKGDRLFVSLFLGEVAERIKS